MNIADLLDAPLYTGSPVTTDVPGFMPIAIDGHPYEIDPSLYERTTIERFRNPYDQSGEPGEHSLEIQGPWKRNGAKWGHGAGQDYWDQNDSDRARFRTSKGVDVWSAVTGQNTQNRVQLLRSTRNVKSTSNTNLDVLAVGAYLYVVDGQQVYWTADPSGASPTWTSSVINHGTGPNTVNDLTTNGTTVWAALGAGGIAATALGASTSSALSTYQATLVEYANGRLVAAKTNELMEIHADGTFGTAIKTHDNTTFAWKTVAGAPNGIYAGGNAGDRAEIYFIGIKDDGSLDVPRYAATLPDGETIQAMFFYNGVMLLATSVGLRLAQVTSADGLAYGSAVKITGGARCLEPQAEFVWFGWKNYDTASTGLGRASLAAFTDTLVPAYASDLMATAQGDVTGVATFGTYRYFAVAGVGIFAEFANRVPSGTLSSGWINFSTTERKVAVSVDLRHEPLAGSIDVTITQESGTTASVGTSATVNSVGPDSPMGITPISSEAFELVLTLNRSSIDATTGPILRWWVFRALITPWRADEIHIPIILREQVRISDLGEGHDENFNPLNEWQWLKTLEATGAPVTYQEGTESYLGYIEQVSSPADKARDWTYDRSFLEGLVMVRFVTLSPSA